MVEYLGDADVLVVSILTVLSYQETDKSERERGERDEVEVGEKEQQEKKMKKDADACDPKKQKTWFRMNAWLFIRLNLDVQPGRHFE